MAISIISGGTSGVVGKYWYIQTLLELLIE